MQSNFNSIRKSTQYSFPVLILVNMIVEENAKDVTKANYPNIFLNMKTIEEKPT